MIGVLPLLVILLVALVFASFYAWARRQGLLAAQPAREPHRQRVSSLTEAVAYIGAILVLAGGGGAIGQRWDDITEWGRVAVFTGTAVVFLALGVFLRGVAEPAVQRLVGVAWLLSVAGLAGGVWLLANEVYDLGDDRSLLIAGIAMTAYAASLWFVRRSGSQQAALFIGLVVTICGVIVTSSADPAPAAFAVALWAFGVIWTLLGWKRYLEPLWVALPLGVILALIAPSFGVWDQDWLYAIAIATAGTAMGASVPLRNTVLLALGTIAMFAYVTAIVVRYFSDSLGVPAALAVTGALVLVLAAVSARLMRMSHPEPPTQQPGTSH